jgi:hypothetical protein
VRKYGRKDANHNELAEAFVRMGCSFLDMSELGDGAPDGAAGFGGISILVEFKDGAKPKSKQKLTPKQRKFWDTWTGGVRLVPDLAAVEETVKLLRFWHRLLCAPSAYSSQPNAEILREMAR